MTRYPSYDPYPHFGRLAADKTSRRVIARLVPLHFWYALRFELSLWRMRLGASSVRRRLRKLKDIRVNIAPGLKAFPGWINIDVAPHAGIDYLYDCRKDLPFADGSVAAIYSEHFFEHMEYSEEAQRFLAECRRCFQRGGILRLVVPDGQAWLKAYASEDPENLRALVAGASWFTGKWNTPMELINLIFRQGIEHKYTYDYETLDKALAHYGFVTRRKDFNESDIPGFAFDSPERRWGSLYIEARVG